MVCPRKFWLLLVGLLLVCFISLKVEERGVEKEKQDSEFPAAFMQFSDDHTIAGLFCLVSMTPLSMDGGRNVYCEGYIFYIDLQGQHLVSCLLIKSESGKSSLLRLVYSGPVTRTREKRASTGRVDTCVVQKEEADPSASR